MKSLSCDQACRLLSDLLAGCLEADEADGVEAHLACCDLCRTEAEALVCQDRMLAELAARGNLTELTQRLHTALATPTNILQAPTPSPVSTPAGQGSPPGRPWGWIAVSAAAVLLGLTLLLWPGRHAAPPAAVARVERIQGEVFVVGSATKTPAHLGQELFAGQGLEVGEDGAAVVTCPDSTRLELGAATTVSWPTQHPADAGQSVYLTEGVLTADMAEPHDGPPMVLTTLQAEVEAPGARLVLEGAAHSTRIELEKGHAQVKDRKAGRLIDLNPGVLAVGGPDSEGAASRPLAPHSSAARATLGGHTGGAWSLAFTADGARLAVGGGDGAVRLWQTGTGQPIATWHEHTNVVRALAFAPDGKVLATAGDDRALRCWDVPSGQARLIPRAGSSTVYALQFSAAGKTLTVASWGRIVNRWDVATGKLRGSLGLGEPQSAADLIGAMAFAADGKALLWGSKDRTAMLVDLAAGKIVHTLRGHEAPVVAAAISPDGRTLATGGRDRTARLWDAATGEARATLRGHRHTVAALAFAPDGKTLASGGSDATVRLWDASAARERFTLQGHTKAVLSVAFAPDGRFLASGGADGTVRLWDVPAE